MTEDSGDTIAVKAPSGEHVAVKVPRERHWTATVPIMAALAVAFAAGGVVVSQNALKEGVERAQGRVDERLKEMSESFRDYARANDARVRALEDENLRRDAREATRRK